MSESSRISEFGRPDGFMEFVRLSEQERLHQIEDWIRSGGNLAGAQLEEFDRLRTLYRAQLPEPDASVLLELRRLAKEGAPRVSQVVESCISCKLAQTTRGVCGHPDELYRGRALASAGRAAGCPLEKPGGRVTMEISAADANRGKR